jgi:hypothetical protein
MRITYLGLYLPLYHVGLSVEIVDSRGNFFGVAHRQ